MHKDINLNANCKISNSEPNESIMLLLVLLGFPVFRHTSSWVCDWILNKSILLNYLDQARNLEQF